MRELLPRIATAPSDLRKKVFIIDEVQRIKEGWDVLLKTLEEPPEHVAFIFCTTDAGSIRPAVLSRVQRFDFRKLTVEQIAGKLTRILAETGREADDDAVDLIARLAAGGMRDAESMLDQLLSGGGDRLTADGVRELLGLADADSVARFVDALAGGDAVTGMAILDDLEDRGRDPRAFLDQVLEAVRTALVAGLSNPVGGPPTGRLAADRPTPRDDRSISPRPRRPPLPTRLALLDGGSPDAAVADPRRRARRQRPRDRAPAGDGVPPTRPSPDPTPTGSVGSRRRLTSRPSRLADRRRPSGAMPAVPPPQIAADAGRPHPGVSQGWRRPGSGTQALWSAVVARISQHPGVRSAHRRLCRPSPSTDGRYRRAFRSTRRS